MDYFGDQPERIYLEISNTQLTRLGISPQQLAEAINSQNAVTHAGTLTTEDDRIFVRPSGQFDDARALGDTLIRVNDKSIRLGDIAEIRRGYQDPPVDQMRLAGKPVLGIGITMQPGQDVVHLPRAGRQIWRADRPVARRPDADRSLQHAARGIALGG